MANKGSVGSEAQPACIDKQEFQVPALKEKWVITIGIRLFGVLLDIQVSKNVSEIMLTLKART